MKKYIIGAVAGFALSLAVTAHAGMESMIGKAVDGAFPLFIDGKKAEKDVIVIEGTSYVPVRVSGEMFGYDVNFSNDQVILTKKGGKPGTGSSGSSGSGGSSGTGSKSASSKDTPVEGAVYPIKSTFLNLGSAKAAVIEQDGEQFISVSAFGNFVTNDGTSIRISINNKQARFAVDQAYDPGADGYVAGEIYVKLSALGLKGMFQSGAWWLEKK